MWRAQDQFEIRRYNQENAFRDFQAVFDAGRTANQIMRSNTDRIAALLKSISSGTVRTSRLRFHFELRHWFWAIFAMALVLSAWTIMAMHVRR